MFFSTPRRSFFGLLDFAREPALYETLEPHLDQLHCLYDGIARIRLARYAPYLYEVHPLHPAFRLWVEAGIGQSWGIFLQTSLATTALALHLRKFLFTHDPNGRQAYFRFYDPQVMHDLIEVLQEQQKQALLRDIDAIIAESGRHRLTRYGLRTGPVGGFIVSVEHHELGITA